MTSIFIIHGAYGNPEENWFPWLKKELEKLNQKVFVPAFPTPENQTLENWMKTFESYKGFADRDSIFIAHSLGVPFVLRLLEKGYRAKACFFVAGFSSYLGRHFDKLNASFIEKPFNWEKINSSCEKFYIFHSDNDPYVSLDKAEELRRNLNSEFFLIKGAGHFNKKAGYSTFPLLLEKIKEFL